ATLASPLSVSPRPLSVAGPVLLVRDAVHPPCPPARLAGALPVQPATVAAGLIPDGPRPRAGLGGDAVSRPGVHLAAAVRPAQPRDRNRAGGVTHRALVVPG